jgi:hypothetical protein
VNTIMEPTSYSHVIHYLEGRYDRSECCYDDLQLIFKASPWGNAETPLNTLIEHLLACWKTMRGKAEILDHQMSSLLTEDLNPNSLLNSYRSGTEYKDLVVSALLGKIATTQKVDDNGHPNYVLLPVSETLKGVMAANAIAVNNENISIIPSANNWKHYQNETNL